LAVGRWCRVFLQFGIEPRSVTPSHTRQSTPLARTILVVLSIVIFMFISFRSLRSLWSYGLQLSTQQFSSSITCSADVAPFGAFAAFWLAWSIHFNRAQ